MNVVVLALVGHRQDAEIAAGQLGHDSRHGGGDDGDHDSRRRSGPPSQQTADPDQARGHEGREEEHALLERPQDAVVDGHLRNDREHAEHAERAEGEQHLVLHRREQPAPGEPDAGEPGHDEQS